jgi:Xaa-Pro aminopeptidase
MITYADVLSGELRRWLSGLRSGGVRMGKLGIEEWHLATAYRDAASKGAGSEDLQGISQALLSMRKTKGADEIEHLKKATEMVAFGYKYARENAVAGKTEEDLLREVNYQAFKKYGAFGEIVGDYVSGERTLNVGGWPTSRKFKKGDTIVLDLQAASENYWSDLCRTFVVGKPSQKQLGALEVLKHAKKEAEDVLRPGTKGKEVYKAVNDGITKAGFPKLTHHAGHTIGLDDQEPPWFIPNDEGVLEEGCVAVVEPGIYVPSTGGMRIEDAYVITRTGCEKISHFPYGLN